MNPIMLTYFTYLLYFTYWNEIVICAQIDSLKKRGRDGLDKKEAGPGWIPLDLGIPLCLLTLLTYLLTLLTYWNEIVL